MLRLESSVAGSAVTVTVSISPGQHCCWAVSDRAEAEALVAEWVRDGLAAGDRMLYLEPASHDGALSRLLDREGIAWREAAGRGQLLVATPETALLVDGEFAPDRLLASHAGLVDQALADGYPAVRMCGAATDLLTVVPDREALRAYEARIDGFCATRPVSILCLYDRRAFEGDLGAFLRTHMNALADSQVLALVEDGRVRLVGEVDLSNVELLTAILEGLPPRDIVVDMGGLSFIDLKGAAELVGLARRIGPEARVTVSSPPPHLARILATLGWTDELDLTVGVA
jgi:anti-anti-sigma regulatory factor